MSPLAVVRMVVATVIGVGMVVVKEVVMVRVGAA
jgi:hypothetical protein